jgi:hypothetical protein
MRPSNPLPNVALYKNLESVVIAPHLLEKICRLASVRTAFGARGRDGLGALRDCLWCSACLHCFPRVFLAATALGVWPLAFAVARGWPQHVRAMLRYVWQAGHTARQFASGPKGIAVPAEPFKKLACLAGRVFGRGT